MAELDEQWSKTKQSALDIKITFPAQCTRREAMQLLHWSMMLGLKRIDLEAGMQCCDRESVKQRWQMV